MVTAGMVCSLAVEFVGARARVDRDGVATHQFAAINQVASGVPLVRMHIHSSKAFKCIQFCIQVCLRDVHL
jgi:hypothetical protein